MRLTVFAAIILATLASCKSEYQTESVNKINALVDEVKVAETDFLTLDLEKIKPYKDTINFKVSFIHRQFEDTMDLDMATKIDVYYRTIKSINKFESAYLNQKKDISYSIQQLNNFKVDVENNIIDSASFKSYYATEKEAVERLTQSNKNLLNWYAKVEEKYGIYTQSIDSLVTEIKKQQGF